MKAGFCLQTALYMYSIVKRKGTPFESYFTTTTSLI